LIKDSLLDDTQALEILWILSDSSKFNIRYGRSSNLLHDSEGYVGAQMLTGTERLILWLQVDTAVLAEDLDQVLCS